MLVNSTFTSIRGAMTHRRHFNSLILLILNTLINYAWGLASPQGLSLESINMRHLLKWRRQLFPCRSTISYSVQFQGEFELTILNGSWEDAFGCQRISRTVCDLTADLGSDSDYNIRMRAECGSQMSAWSDLGRPFNRKETHLTVPAMTLTSMGDALQVMFTELPQTVGVNLTMWKKGEEVQASTRVITVQQNPVHISGLQEGAVYCIRAHAHLDLSNQNSSSDSQCVTIAGPEAAWLKPTTVTVVMVILVGLVLVLSWSVTHCNTEEYKNYFRKEPQPNALSFVRPVTRLKLYAEEELREPAHSFLLIGPHSLINKQPSDQISD
ncbi:hypothetical protein UPYG_G00297080 [Umbra pygmaea]|uniref:Uncharacterized protein n=1 Tax=Umbra pygmaea TaxID=75934 RepID=A0ABD0WQL8_UMBPY